MTLIDFQVAEDEGVPEEGEGCMDCGRGGLMLVCDGCELGYSPSTLNSEP